MYTEGGEKPSQYSYLAVILSNWAPDNWVYRFPIMTACMSMHVYKHACFVKDEQRMSIWRKVLQQLDQTSYPLLAGTKAKQRYFSCRTMLVAIVSQNSFVLVLCVCVCGGGGGGIAQLSHDMLQNGVAQVCLRETNYQGVLHHFGRVPTSHEEAARYAVSQR